MTTYASPTFAATYQGLCTKIADTLNRQDLTTAIPDFTVLATSRISRDMSRINHPGAISKTTLSATSDTVALPSDFVAPYMLRVTGSAQSIEYVTPDQQRQVMVDGWGPPDSPFQPTAPYQAQTTGPNYFSIVGSNILLMPPYTVSAPLSLDLFYYAALSALSATATTNWALTKYPDLYLYGALVHSAPYLKADERIQLWESAYQRILSDIQVEADRATRPQSKLVAARKSF